MMGCEQQTAHLSPIGSQLSSAFGKQCRLQHRAEMGVLHYSLILFLHITSDPFWEVNCEPAYSRLSAGNWPLCSRYVREGLDEEQTRRRNGNDPALMAMLGRHGRQSQIPGCSHRGNGTCGTVSLQNQTISQKIPFQFAIHSNGSRIFQSESTFEITVYYVYSALDEACLCICSYW